MAPTTAAASQPPQRPSSAAASASRARRRSKRRYQAAADIPIVKLNPQNILSAKLRDEGSLRAAGLPYCIVRPCSIDDEAEEGGYVLCSGDLATGRISHQDLAALLVSALLEPAAQAKTVEAFTLPGLLPKRPLDAAFAALPADSADGSPAPDDAAYGILKQLAP